MAMTPAQRSLRGRMGAYAQQARHDTRDTTAAARSAFLAKFEREVDPDGLLPEAERLRRADAALRAHMAGLALKRGRKRRGTPA